MGRKNVACFVVGGRDGVKRAGKSGALDVESLFEGMSSRSTIFESLVQRRRENA